MKYPISVGVLSPRKLREMFNFQKKILPLGLLLLPRLGGAGEGRGGWVGLKTQFKKCPPGASIFLKIVRLFSCFGKNLGKTNNYFSLCSQG